MALLAPISREMPEAFFIPFSHIRLTNPYKTATLYDGARSGGTASIPNKIGRGGLFIPNQGVGYADKL